MNLAEALTTSCYTSYRRAASGLGGEELVFSNSVPRYIPSVEAQAEIKDKTAFLEVGNNNSQKLHYYNNYSSMRGEMDTLDYISKSIEYRSSVYLLRPGRSRSL
jgi:hypothetical protein